MTKGRARCLVVELVGADRETLAIIEDTEDQNEAVLRIAPMAVRNAREARRRADNPDPRHWSGS